MRNLSLLLILCVGLVSSGCFHAKVQTGKPAGGTVVDQPWALSFVYGLIPPPVVDVEDECTNGVAIVETQQSFLNQVVGILTGGLITPMHITVTCAAGGLGALDAKEVLVPRDADDETASAALGEAARRAAERGQPVFLRVE